MEGCARHLVGGGATLACEPKSAGSGASSSRRLRERKGLLPVHGRPRFEPKWRRDKSLMSEIVLEYTAARPSQSFRVPFPSLRVRIFDPASPKACPASAGLDLAPPFPSRRGARDPPLPWRSCQSLAPDIRCLAWPPSTSGPEQTQISRRFLGTRRGSPEANPGYPVLA